MANAVQTAVSNGSLTTLEVGIEFFEQADVRVYKDLSASPLVLGTDYTWSASKTIKFNSNVPAGVTVYLLRQTDIDAMRNIYDGGAGFTRQTLDENFEQLLLLAQEVREGVGLRGLFLPLDMNNYAIKRVGAGTADTDAANLGQIKALDAQVAAAYRAADDLLRAADASLQAQLTGTTPVLASAFSPISWHGQSIDNSVNIPAGKNAWSFGPRVRIANGQRVTVAAGSAWTIANGETGTDFMLGVMSAVDAPAARTALGAAKSGANTDITSIQGSALTAGTAGRASTADAWTTARTITYTGDAVGTVTFDGSSNTSLALTLGQAVQDLIASKANSVSPTLSGTPKSSTPPVGTNTTQIATSAMVQAEIANKRAWAAFTPTLTAASGTYTTVTATGKSMVAFGICHFEIVITVTTKGTGTGLGVTLPFAALAGSRYHVFPAAQLAGTVKCGCASIRTDLLTLSVLASDGTELLSADGNIISISGTYPIA